MPPVPPGYANVQVAGTNPLGRSWLTACGCEIEAWDPADLNDVGTYLTGEQFISVHMATDYFVRLVRVVVGTSNPAAPLVYEQVVNVEGGSTEGASPNTSILVTKRTNLGGRAGRGRSFFPGITESAVNGAGQIVGDLATTPSDIEDFWPDLFTYLNLGDAVLLHTDVNDTPNLITSFTMSSLVSTQRRRLRG